MDKIPLQLTRQPQGFPDWQTGISLTIPATEGQETFLDFGGDLNKRYLEKFGLGKKSYPTPEISALILQEERYYYRGDSRFYGISFEMKYLPDGNICMPGHLTLTEAQIVAFTRAHPEQLTGEDFLLVVTKDEHPEFPSTLTYLWKKDDGTIVPYIHKFDRHHRELDRNRSRFLVATELYVNGPYRKFPESWKKLNLQ